MKRKVIKAWAIFKNGKLNHDYPDVTCIFLRKPTNVETDEELVAIEIHLKPNKSRGKK